MTRPYLGIAVAAVLAACALAGCSESVAGSPSAAAAAAKAHVLVYEITGDGPIPTLTYLDHGKTVTEHDIKLPWTKTLTLPAGQGVQKWDLDIPHCGSAAAAATLDGESVGQSAGSGSGDGPRLHLYGTVDG